MVDLSSLFSDPDGDEITLSVLVDRPEIASHSTIGTLLTVTPVAPGEALVTITASAPEGATAEVIGTIVVAPNHAPVLDVVPGPIRLVEGEQPRSLAITAYDPDGDGVWISASLEDDRVADLRWLDDHLVLTPLHAGETRLTVTAVDTLGSAVSEHRSIVVRVNGAPVFASTLPARIETWPDATPVEFDLAGLAIDPDGDPLTFTLGAAASLPTGSLLPNGTLEFRPRPDELGTYVFDVVVSDGDLSATRSMTVRVNPDPVTNTSVSGQVMRVDGAPLAGITV